MKRKKGKRRELIQLLRYGVEYWLRAAESLKLYEVSAALNEARRALERVRR